MPPARLPRQRARMLATPNAAFHDAFDFRITRAAAALPPRVPHPSLMSRPPRADNPNRNATKPMNGNAVSVP